LPDSPPHDCSMGQETGKKWAGGVDSPLISPGTLQPTIPKSDRLIGLERIADVVLVAQQPLSGGIAFGQPAQLADDVVAGTRHSTEGAMKPLQRSRWRGA